MDHDVWLVVAGGLVAVVASLIPAILQRRWTVSDRRRAADRLALEAAVKKLMGWQDLAVKLLGSGETASADQRLRELDALWESDFDLIPDQAATRELLTLSKDVYFFAGGRGKDSARAMADMSRLMVLLDQVLKSAQEKRRDLA